MRARACVPPSLWWENKVHTGWPWDGVPITAGKSGGTGNSDGEWGIKKQSGADVISVEGEGEGEGEDALRAAASNTGPDAHADGGGNHVIKSKAKRRHGHVQGEQSARVAPTDEATGEDSKATGGETHGSLAFSEMVDFSAPVYTIKLDEAGLNSDDGTRSSSGRGQSQSEGAAQSEGFDQILVVHYSEERKEWEARAGAVCVHGGSAMVFGGLSMRDLILTVGCAREEQTINVDVSEGDVLQTMLQDSKYASVAAAETALQGLLAPPKKPRKLSATAAPALESSKCEAQKPLRDGSGVTYVPHVFTGDAPSARRDCTMSYMCGKILVYGGRNAKGDVLDDLYVLDLVKKRWSCVFSYYAVHDFPVLTSLGQRLITSVARLGAKNAPIEARWLDYDRILKNGAANRCEGTCICTCICVCMYIHTYIALK
jgi:hypothetical protein